MTDMTNQAEEKTSGQNETVSLEEQLAQAQAHAAENLDGWQRARADFVNYRKRADKEREETYAAATVEAYTKMLPVIDDFDLAMTHLPGDENDPTAKSVKLIHRKLYALLESAGVKVIDPVGQPFDTAEHEALGEDAGTSKPSGTVTAVLRKGYSFNGKVIRPALVRVAS